MSCEIPARDWRSALTPGRVAGGALGMACVMSASVVVPGARDQLATVLFIAGGMLLAFVFGLPVASVVETGHPIGRLLTAFGDRSSAMASRIRARLVNTLFDVASDVVLDDARARHLVEQAIEAAASRWRGPIDERLDRFLLCTVVHLGLRDSRSDPVLDPDDPRARLARMDRRARSVAALRRHELSDDIIADLLACPAADLPMTSGPSIGGRT